MITTVVSTVPGRIPIIGVEFGSRLGYPEYEHVISRGWKCKSVRATPIELRLTIVPHKTVENLKQNLYVLVLH